MNKNDNQLSIVVPNWNGKSRLGKCLDSLLAQSLKAHIIVVENGSSDGSLEFLGENYPSVEVLPQKKNLGFAGGVNVGIRQAIKRGDKYVALFNNDATADKNWLKFLAASLDRKNSLGIATCKLKSNKGTLDSTGDIYTVWGLPYPRGRKEQDSGQYDNEGLVFGASGGASLYRVDMLKQIGLFDEDFFAYYEDVDLSFRAQLAGWKITYQPAAIAYHQIGATSSTIKGFATYHTIKNLPWLLMKNVPFGKLLFMVLPRFTFAYWSFVASAILRGQLLLTLKGLIVCCLLIPKKLFERHLIQRKRSVTNDYIFGMMTQDLPPNARRLRAVRDVWWRLIGRKV